MCGIFGYIGQVPDGGQIVLDGLKRLEYRGYDSWGVAVNTASGIKVEKKTGKIGHATTTLPKATAALGHTRWATHGGVTEKNAHPHFDCTEKIALIHNGIVENFSELKQGLKSHSWKSETDTEVIAHLFEEESKKESDLEAFRTVFKKLKGLNAVGILTDSKILVGKNGSPLVLAKAPQSLIVASDATAVLPLTRTVYFIEDGQMAQLEGNKVQIFDIKTGKELKLTWQELDWAVEEADLGEFEHYMLKEIHEQPKVISNIANNFGDQVTDLAEVIKGAQGTFFIGSGTASYAALAGTYLFSKIAHVHVNTQVASEFNYLEDFLTKRSLIIALSQSGETIDVIEPLNRAREKGSKIVAVVNSLGSTIYRMADYKFLLGAGPEIAVASTKAYMAKLSVLLLLAYALTGRLSQGQKLLLEAAKEVKNLLDKKKLEEFRRLCKKLSKHDHIYTIGRGLAYTTSLEAALKIKEVSYIHTEGLPGGELKHGTIALISKGTPCIVFAPSDETYDAIISNATEIKARGGWIIGVGSKPNPVFDDFIEVADLKEATMIPMVVPAQLFGYYLALEKGFDPDKPRNLAKAVTVK